MTFSAGFLAALVYAALALTALGILTLIVLLIRDAKERRLW